MHTAGTLQLDMGRLDEAAEHLQRSYDIRQKLLGEESPQTIVSLCLHLDAFAWQSSCPATLSSSPRGGNLERFHVRITGHAAGYSHV